MIHTRTKFVATVAGILFAVSLSIFAGMVYRLYLFHEELHEEARSVNAAVEKEKQLNAMEQTVAETADERKEISDIILTEDRVVDFLALIEGIGTDLNLTEKTNSLTVAAGKTDIEDIVMNVSFEGPERAVRHAIRLIDALPYRSSIERVTLSAGGEVPGTWIATIELKVAKYKNI